MSSIPPTEDRQAIWPSDVPRPLAPFSPAIAAGGWVFVSGQVASDYTTPGLAPEARVPSSNPYSADPLELQSRYVLRNLAATLRAAGCDISRDVVQINEFFVSSYPTVEELEDGVTWPRISIAPYLRVRDEFPTGRAVSMGSSVRELLTRGAVIEIEMVAIMPNVESAGPDVIAREAASPRTVGQSSWVRRGDWVFASDIGEDRERGGRGAHKAGIQGIPRPAAVATPYSWFDLPIETEAHHILERMSGVAEAAGSSLSRCVKATVYIGHPRDYAAMDRVWRQWFPKNPPARVVVPSLGFGTQGRRMEVTMTLLTNDSPLQIETIETSDAPEPMGHEPQAVKAGSFLFFSTQIAADRNGMANGTTRSSEYPYYGQPARAQMHCILENAAAISDRAGTSLQSICRRQAFHDDLNWWAEAMAEWSAHFEKDPPASTSLGVCGPLLVPGCHVLLDLISYVPKAQNGG